MRLSHGKRSGRGSNTVNGKVVSISGFDSIKAAAVAKSSSFPVPQLDNFAFPPPPPPLRFEERAMGGAVVVAVRGGGTGAVEVGLSESNEGMPRRGSKRGGNSMPGRNGRGKATV